MSSWVGLFAAVWFARDDHRIEDTSRMTRDQQHKQRADVYPPERPSWKRWTSRDETPRVCTVPSTGGHADARDTGWDRVDLLSARPDSTDSRLDQTVALPFDAPDALDATIRALVIRLGSLPDLVDLGRRSAPYRLQLQRTLTDAIRARARLRDGSFGECTTCSAPISVPLLAEKPWSSTCLHCALEI